MVRIASLQDLAETGDADDPCAAPSAVAPEEKRIAAIIREALGLFRDGKEVLALERLLRSRHELRFVPIPVLSHILWLCRRLGRGALAARECLFFARDAFSMGYDNLGLEACAAAMMFDGMGSFEIARDPAALAELARFFGDAACRQPALPRSPARPRPADGVVRVSLLVPHLVDHIVAATKRVLHFARHADRARYRLSVVVTESLSQRDAPMFPYGCSGGGAPSRGAHTLERLRDLGVPVHIAPRSARFIESARDLALRLESDGVDIVLAQTSLACPIDWLALHMARVPVKAAIHTGCSLFLPGMDVTFFDNPANLDRERAWWRPEDGERVLLSKGADLDELKSQKRYDRSLFGIPESATVIGTLSNHLPERLSDAYIETIADVLRARPNAWFLAFGSDPLPDKLARFHGRGVAERVRFGGKQSQVGAALKVLDVYANEFPVGGSQSVMEAMACGVPAVALRWSDAHAESVGAEIAGPEFSFDREGVRNYARLLLDWIDRPDERSAAARTQQRRAEKRFSARDYVAHVLDTLRERHAARAREGAP